MPDESRAVCRRWHTAVMGHQGRATAGVALGTWGGTEGRATAGATLGAGGGAPRAGQRLERLSGWEVGHRGAGQRLERRLGD